MKKSRFFLVGFVLVSILIITGFLAYRVDRTEALDPNHGNCSICHSVHGVPGQSLTNKETVEVLCLSCHGPTGISNLKAEVHQNKAGSSYPAFRMTCMDCHNPHNCMQNWLGGTNLKLVGKQISGSADARISTPNSGIRDVVFESRGTSVGDPFLHSFADGDQDGNGTYDGACEVCHTLTRFHHNNSSGNHNHQTGRTCTTCHRHDTSFHR